MKEKIEKIMKWVVLILVLSMVVFNIFVFNTMKRVIAVTDLQGQYILLMVNTPEIKNVLNNFLNTQQKTPMTKSVE